MTVFFSSAAAPGLGCGQLRILAAVGGAFLTVGPGQNLTLALQPAGADFQRDAVPARGAGGNLRQQFAHLRRAGRCPLLRQPVAQQVGLPCGRQGLQGGNVRRQAHQREILRRQLLQQGLRLRGVRGEVIWLDCPGHGLTRPVRLLHPRHRVYIVPRSDRDVLVGASEIESEDRSPVSLRTATELMAAAHSVVPALAEARILKLDVNLRPALPDNNPLVEWQGRKLTINGLFRHGWLLAPALVEQALRQTGWCAAEEVAPEIEAASAG